MKKLKNNKFIEPTRCYLSTNRFYGTKHLLLRLLYPFFSITTSNLRISKLNYRISKLIPRNPILDLKFFTIWTLNLNILTLNIRISTEILRILTVINENLLLDLKFLKLNLSIHAKIPDILYWYPWIPYSIAEFWYSFPGSSYYISKFWYQITEFRQTFLVIRYFISESWH